MGSRKIGAIWLGGIVLAVLVYVAGPDQFLDQVWAMALNLELALQNLQLTLSASAYDLVRAAAIGLFVVFWLLGLMASRRGLRAKWALFVVSVLFLGLVSDAGASGPRWVGALVLAGVGAMVMTRRLRV